MLKIPNFRLHKASGQGTTKIRGKCYYFGPFDEPESKRRFNELISRYVLSDNSINFGKALECLVLAEVAVEYLEHARTYYGEDTTEYKNIVRAMAPISELMPKMPASEFGPPAFKTIRNWWLQRDVTRGYCNSQMKRVKRMVKWLVAEGKMLPSSLEAIRAVDPLKYGRTTAREPKPIMPVADSIVEATLTHLTDVVADMVRFQRIAGCRPGEVCQITPTMIDQSKDVWEISLAKHKTSWRNKTRTIYVGPKAQEILVRYLADRNPNMQIFSPIESNFQHLEKRKANRKTPQYHGNGPGTNRVVKYRNTSRVPGQAFTTGTYGRAILNACKKAFPPPSGLSSDEERKWYQDHRWAPNQLRHSRATELRRAEGIEAASVILGHSEVGVTQIYAEADRARAIKITKQYG